MRTTEDFHVNFGMTSAREMEQQLRALVASSDGLGLIASIHVAAHNQMELQFQWIWHL